MQPTATHWYFDWTFWAVVMSAVAILLSQLPPISQFIRRAKLGMELYTRAHLTHKVGNPNVQLHVILNNLGGRSIKVRGMTAHLRRDGKDIVTLPAQNFLQQQNDQRTVLFAPFFIKPKEEWAHTVNFLNYFSRQDEKKYRAAESALKRDIGDKRKLLEDEKTIVEAGPPLVRPFEEMFSAFFIWQPGEYELCVSVDAAPDAARISATYRFTLFESDSSDLAAARDDFRTGDGIYYVSGNHPGALVQLVPS